MEVGPHGRISTLIKRGSDMNSLSREETARRKPSAN